MHTMKKVGLLVLLVFASPIALAWWDSAGPNVGNSSWGKDGGGGGCCTGDFQIPDSYTRRYGGYGAPYGYGSAYYGYGAPYGYGLVYYGYGPYSYAPYAPATPVAPATAK